MPVDRRVDPFTGADNSISITREAHTIPSAPNYYVKLSEFPKQVTPSTVVVRNAPTIVDVQPAASDAYIYSGSPGVNYDNADLGFGYNGVGINRSLAQFDLSTVPAAASIIQALVRVNVYTAAVNTIECHTVTSAWTQGTVTWATQPTYNATAETTVALAGAGWLEFDVTDLVKKWKNGQVVNNGVVLRAVDETLNAVLVARSSDYGTPSLRPMLRIIVAGSQFAETALVSAVPLAGQVAVSYDTAQMRFNSADGGKLIEVTYTGQGSPLRGSDTGHPLAQLSARPSLGSLDITSGTTTLTGVNVYDNFTLRLGATLTTVGPLCVIVVNGDCSLLGTVTGDGLGFAGGAPGATGTWSTGGRPGRGPGRGYGGGGTATSAKTAGGGGGGGNIAIGTAGTAGTAADGGAGGDLGWYSDALSFFGDLPQVGGGGGGGGGGPTSNGGAGGASGAIFVFVVFGRLTVSSDAILTSKGAAGSPAAGADAGGGGGGAGGAFWFVAPPSRSILPTPVVTGGTGGGVGVAGGAGANGWWKAQDL